jgi:hypothetical protein
LLIFSILALNYNFSYAATNIKNNDKTAIVKVKNITLVKLSEASGDELYFSIAKYSNKEKPSLVRIPEPPLYWRSKDLNLLNNVVLATETLENGEEVQFIISLIEADSPPFDPDDHIGSIQLNLSNKDGKMEQKWQQPNLVDQTNVGQLKVSLPEFSFAGAGGKYLVNFVIEVK